MSTTAALVEGHYITVRYPDAACQCGVSFDWNDRDKAHALHLLDVVRADHEKVVRERIVRDIEAFRAESEGDVLTQGAWSDGVRDGLSVGIDAARIAREGVAP